MTRLSETPNTYKFAEAQHGGLHLRLRDLDFVCRPAGALWLEAHGLLVVSDLHLEKGSCFATSGQMLPPYDTRETLARLKSEVESLSPRLIVLLGDSFHDTGGEARLHHQDQAQIEALARGRTLIWLAGNHDRQAPRSLPGEALEMLSVAGLDLVHEPTATPREFEVAGHLHPCARVRGRAATIRRRCFITDGDRIVLPAFGAYAGGLNVKDLAFDRILRRPPLAAVMGINRVHAIGWSRLEKD